MNMETGIYLAWGICLAIVASYLPTGYDVMTPTTYRITKVVLHEIGHNLRLKHCFMTDAVEWIVTVDNAGIVLCQSCKPQID